MSNKELRESHTIDATDGAKKAVVALLESMTETARELPEDKRYDVSVEITENDE